MSWIFLTLAVWLASLLLMFPVFYMAMLALYAMDWMHRCVLSAAQDDQSDLRFALAVPFMLAVAVLVIAATYDWIINHTSAVLLFWDKPQEVLVTGRLERYKNGEDGWRKRFAQGVCTKCLDWADPSGRHCN